MTAPRITILTVAKQGPAGAQGPEGPAGPSEGRWHAGSGAPAAELGEDTHFYHDQDTDDVYHKAAGAWSLVGTLSGGGGGGSGAFFVQQTSPTEQEVTDVGGIAIWFELDANDEVIDIKRLKVV